jgi:deazaflavin-dependent oxidoreductase (nitroreductase family)
MSAHQQASPSRTRDGRATYDRDVPSDLVLKVMNGVHRLVLGASHGRFGWSASGMPVVELTTIGRRSGHPRTTLLTSPYQEGPTLVVVASRGGDDRQPAWFLNLRDQPQVTVSVGGKPPQTMRAKVAGPDERARLWPLVTADHHNYANYQRKTDREIPLVLLHPIEG